MSDTKLPVRMLPDGTDWVPAWRLRDYEAAVDALERLVDLAATRAVEQAADSPGEMVAALTRADRALARLRGTE